MPQIWADWLILDFSSEIYIYLHVNLSEKKKPKTQLGVPTSSVSNNRPVTLKASIKYGLQISKDGERNVIRKGT